VRRRSSTRRGAVSGTGEPFPRGHPLRFSAVRLRGWRNFPRVDVAMPWRVFLVGPNASGKSNFLGAIEFLRDVATAGGLQLAVETRGGMEALLSHGSTRSTVLVGVKVQEDGIGAVWDYEVEFGQGESEQTEIKRETVARDGARLLIRPNADDSRDPRRLSQTSLEQVSVNEPFRELVELIGSVRCHHMVPQLMRTPELHAFSPRDFHGSDFLARIGEMSEGDRDHLISIMRSVLRSAIPQLADFKAVRDVRGDVHLAASYRHWRDPSAYEVERAFSDGTLRLAGVLWALLDGTGPVLLEEPELNLHPGVVQTLPQLFARFQTMARRQIIVSTHSSELLSDEGIGVDEVLLFLPGDHGTEVRVAGSLEETRALLEGGLTMADVAIPRTQPNTLGDLPTRLEAEL